MFGSYYSSSITLLVLINEARAKINYEELVINKTFLEMKKET